MRHLVSAAGNWTSAPVTVDVGQHQARSLPAAGLR